MTWKKDKEYQNKCVLAVCSKLEINNPDEIAFVADVAYHSDTDREFFNKIKTLYSLDRSGTTSKAKEKNIVKMGEWTDGKDNLLPPILEATLRDLRGDN